MEGEKDDENWSREENEREPPGMLTKEEQSALAGKSKAVEGAGNSLARGYGQVIKATLKRVGKPGWSLIVISGLCMILTVFVLPRSRFWTVDSFASSQGGSLTTANWTTVTTVTTITTVTPEKLPFWKTFSCNYSDLHAAFANSTISDCRLNYMQGRWVLDLERPSPYPSCPGLYKYNCARAGRQNDTYQHWRWQASTCHIPEFSVRRFVQALHCINKRRLWRKARSSPQAGSAGARDDDVDGGGEEGGQEAVKTEKEPKTMGSESSMSAGPEKAVGKPADSFTESDNFATLAFAGDSLGENMFLSLTCMITAQYGRPESFSTADHRLCRVWAGELQVRVCQFWAPYLIRLQEQDNGREIPGATHRTLPPPHTATRRHSPASASAHGAHVTRVRVNRNGTARGRSSSTTGRTTLCTSTTSGRPGRQRKGVRLGGGAGVGGAAGVAGGGWRFWAGRGRRNLTTTGRRALGTSSAAGRRQPRGGGGGGGGGFDSAPWWELHVDRLASGWIAKLDSVDVIVVSTAHWWNYEKLTLRKIRFVQGGIPRPDMSKETAVRLAVRLAAEHIIQLMRNGSFTGQAYFRSFSPVHFTGGKWNTGGRCDADLPMTEDRGRRGMTIPADSWKDAMKSCRECALDYLDITHLSNFRSDGHPSKYTGKGGNDCSHWCLPGVPDTWNEILLMLMEMNLAKGLGSVTD
ncbi:hypothetical protein CBR_g32175 [Chara braunii]|uniref:Uncharacterized protein n=1 Tax=Chara braunii TaxID=69332 RepID=A0A388JMW9_CHABU|nr:hypothetical protein CBR_g32175 [Chara braunii]|eukprot:GBG59159.1 hypothetical protein CBR_g32175 [Chara braunii]